MEVQLKNPFDDFDESIPFERKEELTAALAASGISDDVAAAMLEELEETEQKEHNVMFVSTDGHYAVKAIHVPESSIGNVNGPVLFPCSNPNVILAAFSKEYIQEQINYIENLDAGLRDDAWVEFLELLNDKITLECEAHPPTWKDL
jgi:hypothetical protein